MSGSLLHIQNKINKLNSKPLFFYYHTLPVNNVHSVWDCKTMLGLMFYFPPPLLISPEQQSVHAKEATEGMEVAILKTCQSLNDLRREVSCRLSPVE